MASYSFEDWQNGEPENWNGNPIDGYGFPRDRRRVFLAKIDAFDKIVKINVTWIIRFIRVEINKIDDPGDRVFFLNKQISIYEERIVGVSRVKIIQGPHEWDLEFIDGYLYKRAVDFIIPDEDSFRTILVDNKFCNATIAHKVIREIEQLILDLGEEELTQKSKLKKSDPKLSGPIKYLLLKEFFELNGKYKFIKEGQKVDLISKIIGVNQRMAKGLKNNEERYFSLDTKIEASDLINKIKKGA